MSHPSENQDFDLNLAPIIDCFTVLITFMLISASFLAIGIIDAGAAIASATPDANPPAIAIELKLMEGFKASIQLSGKSSEKFDLTDKNGVWDYDGIRNTLEGIKGKWSGIDSIILSAADPIEYEQLIQVMDHVRKTMPGIVLGGF